MGTAQQTSPVVTVTRLAARLHRVWRALVLCVVLLGIGLRSVVTAAAAQGPIVYVIPIDRTIHLGVAPFVQRTLDEAAQQQAAAVVLEMETFGGRVAPRS